MTRRRHESVLVGRAEAGLWASLALTASIGMLYAWAWQIRINDWSAEAAGPFRALLHGHLRAFLTTAPSYGPSLVLRAPFALPASLAGASQLSIYRLAAVPCVIALAALAAWLACELRRHGAGLLTAGVTVALCAASPIAFKALVLGHPEELLGAALCAAAVLLAARGRANCAALALGVAIANKQWALLAVGPVLLALPDRRWRTLLFAGATAALFEAPMLLASTTASAASSRLVVNDTGAIFHPWQIFWFLGTPGRWTPAMAGYLHPGWRLPPAFVGGRAHLVIVWLGLPLTLLAAWRGVRGQQALLLLALLLALRCWLDPWDNPYYPLPFIVALLAWEAAAGRRFPIATAAATGATWLIFDFLPNHLGMDAQALSFLVPATLALAALAVAVYRPRSARSVRRRAPALSPARAVPS